MIKKNFLIILIVIIITGCSNKSFSCNNGLSKTYSFFKDFNIHHYYASFFDRNISKNDDSKIIFARDNDRYYYEINGSINSIIIQKDDIHYVLANGMYHTEESSLIDYSHGILPSDIEPLRKKSYSCGREKIFGKSYFYEKYYFDNYETYYFFNNSKLIYIRYNNLQGSGLLKINYIKNDFDDKIFDVYKKFEEIKY